MRHMFPGQLCPHSSIILSIGLLWSHFQQALVQVRSRSDKRAKSSIFLMSTKMCLSDAVSAQKYDGDIYFYATPETCWNICLWVMNTILVLTLISKTKRRISQSFDEFVNNGWSWCDRWHIFCLFWKPFFQKYIFSRMCPVIFFICKYNMVVWQPC